MIYYTVAQSSLGHLLMAKNEQGICWLSLGDSPDRLLEEFKVHYPLSSLCQSSLAVACMKLMHFIDNPTASPLALPLSVSGTAFQQRVWQALMDIPVGQTATYSEVAARIHAPKAARAVARACALNTVALLVPCHRVVRQDGQLSGYRWGVARKRELLRREQGALLSY